MIDNEYLNEFVRLASEGSLYYRQQSGTTYEVIKLENKEGILEVTTPYFVEQLLLSTDYTRRCLIRACPWHFELKCTIKSKYFEAEQPCSLFISKSKQWDEETPLHLKMLGLSPNEMLTVIKNHYAVQSVKLSEMKSIGYQVYSSLLVFDYTENYADVMKWADNLMDCYKAL